MSSLGGSTVYPDKQTFYEYILSVIQRYSTKILNTILYGSSNDEKTVFQCNNLLMASFSFGTNTYVTADKQIACTNLPYSCCGLREQQLIEANLITGNQQIAIQRRLEFYKDVYSKLIEFLTESQSFTEDYLKQFVGSKINNCYVMAKQMSQFDVRSIKEEFLKELDEMYSFVEKSQVGSYCSACDFFNHSKVKFRENQIVYSEKFC